MITLLPLVAGMIVRQKAPTWTIGQKPGLDRAALVIFVLVVIAAVVSEWDPIVDNFAKVALATLVLNLLAMSISFGAARAIRLYRDGVDGDLPRTRHPQRHRGDHGRQSAR